MNYTFYKSNKNKRNGAEANIISTNAIQKHDIIKNFFTVGKDIRRTIDSNSLYIFVFSNGNETVYLDSAVRVISLSGLLSLQEIVEKKIYTSYKIFFNGFWGVYVPVPEDDFLYFQLMS